ncbi:CXD4 protein, partial [Alectura lathami]|nr:CXD4 protein [Alectura lathami]
FPLSLLGKIWLMLIILLRMAVVVLAGYPLYQDEQERFVCNTLQPGCSNVCYDLFSPISHFRFWLVQTVSILLPYAAFSTYVLHRVAMYIVRTHCLVGALVNRLDCNAHELSALDFSGAYTIHLFFRTLLEAVFAAAQYHLFGFFVPERFSCYHSPCTSTVDCYISRPTEKSIMMIFVWGVTSLSFLLSLADLVCALQRMRARNQRNKLLANLHREDEGILNLPPVQPGSSSQNQDCPALHSSQTSDGSCSLLSEGEEEAALHPEDVSLQAASTNLNSNSRKPSMSGDLAVKQDSIEEPQCAGDQQATACQTVRPRLQQAELKNPDAQSNYSSTSCLRSKKSEWV